MQRLFFVLNCLRSLHWVILPFDETLPGHVGAPLDFAEMRCVNTQPCQHICLDDSRQPTLAFKKACGGCRQARDLHTRAVLSCPGSRFLIAKKTIYLPSFFFMNWATDETKKKKIKQLIDPILWNTCMPGNTFALLFQIVAFSICTAIKHAPVRMDNLTVRSQRERGKVPLGSGYAVL